MILLLAILFILFEAIGEGLLKRYSLTNWIFNPILQWVIVVVLFGTFLLISGVTPKFVLGFIFVRFMIFDVAWNLARGVRWDYYGETKLYDRIMVKLASWGWFLKFVLGVIGISFLIR